MKFFFLCLIFISQIAQAKSLADRIYGGDFSDETKSNYDFINSHAERIQSAELALYDKTKVILQSWNPEQIIVDFVFEASAFAFLKLLKENPSVLLVFDIHDNRVVESTGFAGHKMVKATALYIWSLMERKFIPLDKILAPQRLEIWKQWFFQEPNNSNSEFPKEIGGIGFNLTEISDVEFLSQNLVVGPLVAPKISNRKIDVRKRFYISVGSDLDGVCKLFGYLDGAEGIKAAPGKVPTAAVIDEAGSMIDIKRKVAIISVLSCNGPQKPAVFFDK